MLKARLMFIYEKEITSNIVKRQSGMLASLSQGVYCIASTVCDDFDIENRKINLERWLHD